MAATKMIFRVFNAHPRDVIAFIPDASANRGYVGSYMHVGQHSEADYHGLLSRTRPATKQDRAPLVRELRGIYGPIRIIRKLPKGST